MKKVLRFLNILSNLVERFLPSKDLSKNRKMIIHYLTEYEGEKLPTKKSIELYEAVELEFNNLLSKAYIDAVEESTTIDEYFKRNERLNKLKSCK